MSYQRVCATNDQRTVLSEGGPDDTRTHKHARSPRCVSAVRQSDASVVFVEDVCSQGMRVDHSQPMPQIDSAVRLTSQQTDGR
jgi:hypothetical protein